MSVRAHGGTGETTGPGPATWRPLAPRLPGYALIAAVVLGMLSLGLPNIAPGVDFLSAEGSPVRMFFGVSEEMNLPTFLSVMVVVAAACLHVLVGWLVGGRTGLAFHVTGAVLLALAFDDFAALHERLKAVVDLVLPAGSDGYLWVVPALVPAAVVVAAFWQVGKVVHGPARRDLLLGLLVFLLAAFGLETVNGLLDRPGTNGAPLQLGTHLEELTEDIGLILLLRGSLAMLETTGRRVLGVRVAPSAVDSPVPTR